MRRILIILPFMIWQLQTTMSWAHIHGIVLDDNGEPLVGANIWWKNTTQGTTTNAEGQFELEPVHTTRTLITSYIGYRNDTTEVVNHKPLTILLLPDMELNEVEITERKSAILRSRVEAVNVTTLTGQELCKAACCNLSESFETSAAVDVAYADAATGAKQIRLLGLEGTYVQMLTENTPNVRGLAQSFGMEYIPGSWMDAIQVSKGTSSVLNGYESITGQINVEYLKPQTTSPIAINAMVNTDLRAEMNLTGGWDINPHLSTALLLHAKDLSMEHDKNNDGFLDMPKNHHLNALNRWYIKNGDYTGQVLVRALYDQRIGGQSKEAQSSTPTPYSIQLKTRRIDGFIKNGYLFNEDLGTSIGIIAAASYHDQNNTYGLRTWDASQGNAYLNGVFQTNFENERLDPDDLHDHKLSTGVSLVFDHYNEQLLWHDTLDLSRQEYTPGVFAEYTYNYLEKVTLLAGIREDWSSRYGFFTTPRLNIRYAPFAWWTLRGNVGLGHRTPNLIADHAQYLSSNRQYYLLPANDNRQYLTAFATQETSLNTGATTTFYIPIGNRELQLTGEYYYTRFLQGIIADIDHRPDEVNLIEISRARNIQQLAHNFQIEANMELLRGWTMTLAFRYTDTKQSSYSTLTQAYELRQKPLQNRYKGIISTSYQTPKKGWQIDLTAQFNGQGRMPEWFTNPDNGQYFEKNGLTYHRWYPQLMAQVTKFFHGGSVYLGAENITNFTQKNPIQGSKIAGTAYVDGHSSNYDATMIWAPINGWSIHLGVRWALEKKEDEHHHEGHHHDHH